MKEEYYRQCRLVNSDGYQETSWIPEEFAKVGKYLKIYFNNNGWINGWKVVEVYDREPLSNLLKRERDYLKQREESDV